MDLGRAQSIETLVRRSEAVEQRLSYSLRQAELVDAALAELHRQLIDAGETRADHALTASVRALLAVAAGEEQYDATLVPNGSRLSVRVHRSLFGLQADVVHPAPAAPAQGPHVDQFAASTPSQDEPQT